METSKSIAKNLLNGFLCKDCIYYIAKVEDVVYESGREGEMFVVECTLHNTETSDNSTCISWKRPLQGSTRLIDGSVEFYDGGKWVEI